MSVVFVKTPKGTAEIQSRDGGLTPRMRRILIMIDGKRSVDEIRTMALADDLSHSLGMLEEEGYIEVPQQDLPPAAADGGLAGITTFRELPAVMDPKELDMAKNFIMNTLRTFCGPMSHLTIIEKSFAAKNHAELREQFGPWYAAIVDTRTGRRRAEELRGQLLKVI